MEAGGQRVHLQRYRDSKKKEVKKHYGVNTATSKGSTRKSEE